MAAEEKKKKSDLGVRTFAGFIYVAVSAACVLINDLTTALYLAVIAGMCAFEFYRMMREDAKLVNELIGIVAACLYPIAVFFWGTFGIVVTSVVLMMVLVVWYVFYQKARIMDLCLSFFGAIYMGLTLSCLLLIRMQLDQPWGGVLVLILMMSVWFNDAGAYLVGSKIGKHKMAPLISPKKSWEGFCGGLVVSVLFWCIMRFVPGVDMSIAQAIVFGIICGSMGIIGDLAESRIKRNVGVKDSGNLMPGHGGMFDRSDSLITSTVTAAFLLFIGGCIPLGL